ncbi:MAG: NADH-quinone oxidoreductase subunit C, partial [Parvibaculaceae bacterium]
MPDTLNELGTHIATGLGAAVLRTAVPFGELTIEAEAAQIVKVLRFLRDDGECRFVCFTDICGADYPEREKRFDIVYHLLSPYKNHRIRVKVATDEMTPVPSVITVFPAADWFEREV